MAGGLPPPPLLIRTTSAHSKYVPAKLWAFERDFPGQEAQRPVKLVVFDCDETLTISTFLPNEPPLRSDVNWNTEWADYISRVNFQSPFVDTPRIQRLKDMFLEIMDDGTDVKRTLAILTRNNAGAVACMNLLKIAGLREHFSAIWSMYPGVPSGVYNDGGTWKTFSPPLGEVPDTKADVLHCVAEKPASWFPQMQSGACPGLAELKLEEIVLVDDVSTNFQSGSSNAPKKVLRCCKVAQFDGQHPDVGMVNDMGGIGAHSDDDYTTLVDFVRCPWNYKTALSVRCVERSFEGSDLKPPVKLIVFGFDETLSLKTFLPKDKRFSTEIGCLTTTPHSKDHYIEYNFESPYASGQRLPQLRDLLRELKGETENRIMAVLTKNAAGAVAVLNLLTLAGLSEYFSAIWTMGAEGARPCGVPSGVYKDGTQWKTMPLPSISEVQREGHKAHVLQSIVDDPAAWFPQMVPGAEGGEEMVQSLRALSLEGIVLVDENRESFKCCPEGPHILRYCKVGSYDDEYRDQGFLVHMGGIGARTEDDYKHLRNFVERPWHFAEIPVRPRSVSRSDLDGCPIPLRRSMTEEELRRVESEGGGTPVG
eukprot:TRINITY_DN60556_c0_g1_i1.p1 TRINITY_DN60556_c0_g1~~TRINITY_DN60556_c0_g1_i1.p1  ORF type:complete len:593 (+),score=80.50 TRINITY_DN60556_c0_g1_i1:74-1852(+)